MASYRILTLLAVFSSLILVFQLPFTECEESIDTSFDESIIVQTFPGLFKMEEEIAELNRGISTTGPLYDACCIINSSLIVPTSIQTIRGETVTVVQFQNLKQYIEVDTCRQADNCNECTCVTTERHFTLLAIKNRRLNFELIKYPAVYRCLNRGKLSLDEKPRPDNQEL